LQNFQEGNILQIMQNIRKPKGVDEGDQRAVLSSLTRGTALFLKY